jgi:hypothetical protein
MDHTKLASLGGKARAKKLSKKRRQDIARDAVRERWRRVKDAKR